MKNVVWVKGKSGLDGEFQSGSDVDFYIDKVSCWDSISDDENETSLQILEDQMMTIEIFCPMDCY